jgi:galactokinase
MNNRLSGEDQPRDIEFLLLHLSFKKNKFHCMSLEQAKEKFHQRYGTPVISPRIYFAPGRVNLIGEHTDYNGGYVFPCALNFGTYLVIAPNGTDKINLATTNFEFTDSVAIHNMEKNAKRWTNYPMGVMDQFLKRGFELKGLDMMFSGTIPHGAGLSSSASIEMVTAIALNELLDFKLDMIDLIKLSQKAENEFVGVNCGIMDQFASGMGKKNNAVFINCATLEYQNIPMEIGDHKIIISNTNKRHSLSSSKYNERRSQCELAVDLLSEVKKVDLLGELNMEEFNRLNHLIKEDVILRRARHVISENNRVLEAIKALQKNDLQQFGQLMNESHDSLREDYEVTGTELDTLVEEARKVPGVLGSRMTGAGFGGCSVSLVNSGSVDQFIQEVGIAYKAKTGLKPDFYTADIGDGARRLE